MRMHASIRSRRLLALVIILAIGFRSLIPAGFMPDFSGHNHNPFALTVCDGMHHHHSPDGKQDRTDVCAFSVGAVYGFDDAQLPVIVPPTYEVVLDILSKESDLRLSRNFSNASPRSPPISS